VGRDPRALAVAFDSLWVANYRDKTVARIDRATGHAETIAVGGHPTGIAASAKVVWVWTLDVLAGTRTQMDGRAAGIEPSPRLPRSF